MTDLDPLVNRDGRKKLSYKPMLLTALCAFLLAGGSCAGFLGTLNLNGRTPKLNAVYFACFVCFTLIFFGGLIWTFVAYVKNSRKED
jgi:hypothetical protein